MDIRENQQSNIAVTQDNLICDGGSQRVSIELARYFGADLLVGQFDPENAPDVSDLNVINLDIWRGTRENKFLYVFYQLLRPFALKNITHNYDIIICSGHQTHMISKHKAKKFWYCHSPVRYVYDMYYPLQRKLNFAGRITHKILTPYIRYFDQKAVKEIETPIITNSQNVSTRVLRYYGKESKVIRPFYLPIKDYKEIPVPFRSYFLSVQRFAEEKRIDIQIEAFKKTPEKNLLIVGNEPNTTQNFQILQEKIKDCPNIEIIRCVSDSQLNYLYKNATATIQTSMFEDFGLVPVESQANGTPVIAVDEEGMKETIKEEVTGHLVSMPYVENLSKTVSQFIPGRFDSKTIKENVKDFTRDQFMKDIEETIIGETITSDNYKK